MSAIEKAIIKGKRRRKLLAVTASLGILVLAAVYAGWLFFTAGYSLTVVPADAAKNQQFAVQQGHGFFIDNKLFVIGSDATVQVRAQRYRPAMVSVDGSSPSNIEVRLAPLPAQVRITPSPAAKDVQWSVNGQPVTQSDIFDAELENGHYTISARHPAYEPATLSFTAAIAQQIEKQLPLTPVSGEMNISSTPSGAAVTIDGENVGQTPLTLQRQGGAYAVTVEKAGYQRIEDSIRITAANTSPSRNYYLKPLQALVDVSTTPAGGALLVNGAPATSPVSIAADAATSIRYEKAGYRPQSHTLTLSPGETQRLQFTLEPEVGDVRIEATEVASVEVNGKPQGTTPLVLTLQALPTDIAVRKQGYRTVRQTLTPSPDQPSVVRAEMLREFDARRREGTPLFATGLGIEMVKVTPRAFVMGSPRNDSDRKSNEHQINVDFSRDVWLSRHEITQTQYNASLGKPGGSNKPVTNVSWQQAAAFTNWLSEKEGLRPFYTLRQGRVVRMNPGSRGYRLPTEAEWEFIARLNGRAAPTTYVWGSQKQIRDNQGNFADETVKGKQTFYLRGYSDGHTGLAPVGSFEPERGGFFDLDGNAREWVHDRYTLTPPDTTRPYTDYLGAMRGESHVVKGASYKTGRLKYIRATAREGESKPADDIGFRIARYDK